MKIASIFFVGPTLFNLLKDVSVFQEDNMPVIEFQSDGSQRFIDMKIVNLQSQGEEGTDSSHKQWEEIGTWQTHNKDEDNLDKEYTEKTGYVDNISLNRRFDLRTKVFYFINNITRGINDSISTSHYPPRSNYVFINILDMMMVRWEK